MGYGKFIRQRKKELENLYHQLPTLSENQKEVADKLLNNENVFLTGSPGCGKSVALLNVVRRLMEQKYMEGRDFYLCAPTGVASYLIGGKTLHRAFSLPIQTDVSFEQAYENVFSLKKRSWYRLKFLIIDEISMVPGRLFSMIDYFLRISRGKNRPFGGVTILCVGDFCQLPPVPQNGEDEDTVQFTFETKVWAECNFRTINLTIPFRQQGDKDFVDMITRIRYGEHTEKDIQLLSSRIDVDIGEDEFGIKPTCIFTHRYMVRELNESMLQMIEKEKHTFIAKDYYENDFYKQEIERICPSPPQLELKEGAQVMVTRNIYDDSTGFLLLANGTKGVILDIGEEDIEVTSPLETEETSKKVRYVQGRFENGLEHRFYPEDVFWCIMKKKQTVAYRYQIPLMLCWAITVHKSQGQTISRGVVCVDKAFAAGQVMVAISRFRRLEDFAIYGNINPHAIRANDRVIDFYQQL